MSLQRMLSPWVIADIILECLSEHDDSPSRCESLLCSVVEQNVGPDSSGRDPTHALDSVPCCRRFTSRLLTINPHPTTSSRRRCRCRDELSGSRSYLVVLSVPRPCVGTCILRPHSAAAAPPDPQSPHFPPDCALPLPDFKPIRNPRTPPH